MGKSKIEWCDRVWNVMTGCTKISRGCERCYAERMSKRLAGQCGYPKDGFKVTLHPERLDEPLRWEKPSRIFVCSMGDLFHENVPLEFLTKVMTVIDMCKRHTFLLLTKRAERMHGYVNGVCDMTGVKPPANLWFGVSVEDQKTADERIPLLLDTPAAKRYVICEPALGLVDFKRLCFGHSYNINALEGVIHSIDPIYLNPEPPRSTGKLDLIIMGGESGPGARPMHPDWARSIRDQCATAGVPFFFKQWGEWIYESQLPIR